MGMAALLPRSYDMMASTSRRLLAPFTVERNFKRVLISVPALFPSGMDVNSLFLCRRASTLKKSGLHVEYAQQAKHWVH